MKILIICSGNSCRSQMAEYFLKSFNHNLEVYSAGSSPEKKINQRTLIVMKEVGIYLFDAYPKNINTFITDTFDYVITVCDQARQKCPVFKGTIKNRIHMGFDDPAKASGTEEEIMAFYRKIRDQIKNEFYKFYLNIKPLNHE